MSREADCGCGLKHRWVLTERRMMRSLLALVGTAVLAGCSGASTGGGDPHASCAAPVLQWKGQVYVPREAKVDVSLGGQVGTWTYRSCPDASRVELDEEGNPVRTVVEGVDDVSVPLYRIEGIDPQIAVSDGNRIHVAESFTGNAMPDELRQLLTVGAEQPQPMQAQSCQMAVLALAVGPEVSAATGQHPLSVRLINRGPSPCLLYGYPMIELRDRAGTIPFSIRHGGDQMVTSERPERVLVRVGQGAFVVLNKYRCDRGNVRAARILRLGLPGASPAGRASIAIRPRGWIQYCGKGDPGSTVSVSPFEPTLRAALRH
jgi:hypothetical protein